MKTAYIFPGQGSQFTGMGEALYNSNESARAMFEKANRILGFRITDIMFSGTAEQLKQTQVTQPAIFLHSAILARHLPDFHPDMVAGHSLGEFSALVAAGALNFEDGLKLVAIRAQAMQKACMTNPGTMAAILMLPADKVEEICVAVSEELGEDVVAANYNCEGQIVISGTIDAVNKACERCKEAGARRALPLPVGGAFHSPLMAPARTELAEAIEKIVFNTPACPVYQNFTAQATCDPDTIKSNLLAQLTAPVKWTQTVRNMVADGAASFIEIGPGKVLQGLTGKTADAGISISGIE